MDRYPHRPRAPFTSLTFGDYVWWGLLIFFRLWLLCQIVTGIGALIYWWLPYDVSEFFFRNYITIWTVYLAPLLPDQLWLMPMWYETSTWPIIAVILILRILELLRRVPRFQGTVPNSFGAFLRKPEQAHYSSRSARPRGGRDDEYSYDPLRFATEPAQSFSNDRDRPFRLRLENMESKQGDAADTKAEKAERLLQDPNTPHHIKEAAQRLIDRRQKRQQH